MRCWCSHYLGKNLIGKLPSDLVRTKRVGYVLDLFISYGNSVILHTNEGDMPSNCMFAVVFIARIT